MIKVRDHQRIWLAAIAAAIAAAGVLVVPAQARQASPAASTGSADGGHGSWVIRSAAAYKQAVRSGNWVATTVGLLYKTCVYHAPNHAVVMNNEIVAPDGAVQKITKCTHPTIAYPASGATATLTAAQTGVHTAAAQSSACPDVNANTWWAASCLTWPNWMDYMQEGYAVPSDPAKDGADLAFWGGLQQPSTGVLLQNVLEWAVNGWQVESEYVENNAGTVGVIGYPIGVQPNDTIYGYLATGTTGAHNAGNNGATCGSGGACTWTMTIEINGGPGAAVMTVGSDSDFRELLGAVMEQPNDTGNGCVETPASGHAAFRNLIAEDYTGNVFTPAASDWTIDYPHSECSVKLDPTATGGGADILWSP